MKSSLDVIALLTGTALTAAIVITLPSAAIALSPSEISKIAEQVTVKIDGQNQGSGVIIAREGNDYYVLTAKHVVETEDEYDIIINNQRRHKINYANVIKLPNVDLAIVRFTSSETYNVANLASSANQAAVGADVFVSGYPQPGRAITQSIHQLTTGRISARPQQALQDGYALVYTNITGVGMSGGPVLDSSGQVIGIHGRTEGQDNTKPGFNLGIPIDTFWQLAPKAYAIQGIAKLNQEDYAGANSDFSQALRLNSRFSEGWVGRGYARFALGDFRGAAQDAEQAVQSPSADGYRLLGAANAQLNRHRDAIDAFNRAIQLDGRSADAYGLRGVSYAQTGDFKAANQDVAEAIRLDPNNPMSYLYRSIVRSLVNDADAAKQDKQRAIELSQSNSKLSNYQIALNRGLGNPISQARSSSGSREQAPKPTKPSDVAANRPSSTPKPSPTVSQPAPQPKLTPTAQPKPQPAPVSPPPATTARETPRPSSSSSGLSLLKTLTSERDTGAVAISSDGKTLVNGAKGGQIQIWDLATGKLRGTLPGHFRAVRTLMFSPDGSLLASGGEDKTAKVWDLRRNQIVTVLRGFQGDVYSVAFSRSGQSLATAAGDGTIKLWSPTTGKLFRSLEGHSDVVYAIAFSPDGKTLASASGDQLIKLWDLSNGEVLKTFSGHEKLVRAISFTPDGGKLISGAFDRTIRLWEVSSGQLVKTLPIDGFVYSIAVNPKTGDFAVGSDAQLKLWSLATQNLIGEFSGHSAPIRTVVFSPDGQTLASSSEDKEIKIWQSQKP